MTEGSEGGFGDEMKRRLVEEFAVSYINGSIKPNLAEKNPTNGRDVEYLMDAPQLDKTKKTDVWAYANAVGSGYQYRVVYKDRRFSDMDRLVQVYSGTIPASEGEGPAVEQKLYELVMLMIKEGRLPRTFQLRSTSDTENEKLVSMVEELRKSLDELGSRVKKLEEQVAVRNEVQARDEQQVLA